MIRAVLFGGIAVCLAAGRPAGGIQEIPLPAPPEGYVLLKTVTVPGGPGWTDTGIDVVRAQEFWFDAAGVISLQKGNPEANCGPDGLEIRTMQQPVLDRNFGCLVGKIRYKIDVLEDKETGEKRIQEYGETFFIGKSGSFTMTLDGRLLLGPNENVTGDNDGAFVVRVFRKGEGFSSRSSGPGIFPGTGCRSSRR